MRKVLASFAWSVALAGIVVPWTGLVSGSARPVATASAGLLLVAACVVAASAHRVPRLLVLAVVATAAAAAGGASMVVSGTSTDAALVLRDGLLLGAHALLCATLFGVTRRRLRTDGRAVLVDGAVVGLGSWVVLWVLLLQPALSGSEGLPAVTTLRGVTLTLLAVALFLLATVVFSDAQPTPAVTLSSLAVIGVLCGEILYLVDSRDTTNIGPGVLLAPFLSAAALTAAALLHPSSRILMSPSRRRSAPPLMTRLVTVTASMVAPVILLSATDPESANDRSVRTVSVVVLAAAVMMRVVQAVRANARTQADLVRNAQTDPLTGLPNRTAMLELIEDAATRAWGTSRQPTVLFIDVDRFKNINDSLGHSAGDDVLLEVARRLVSSVPAHARVGRISGDEFVVLDPATESATQAVVLAEHVLDSLRSPLALRQGDMFVSASIGVAMAVRSLSLTADEILRHADTAMFRAPAAGRNCIAFFDDSMVERVTHRLDMETALYRALEKGEVRLVHQPIIDTQLGIVVGFESLMRWDRGDSGTVSPAEFIPIAEETGTIVPLGSWALHDALVNLRQWMDAGTCGPHTTISVNVSARQLHDPTFVSVVSDSLSRAGVPADRLWLEVTESVMIAEPTQALSSLRQLNSLGVRIAIDDFGTGYSSLSLLQRFPIQRVKIDRAFVNELQADGGTHTLVRTIIAMAESLGADVVAEGVETLEQMDVLSSLQCHKAQGYLISHPVPSDAVAVTVTEIEDSPQWRR
ncbi:MAG: putative bifunctional diguanylate cyclase/phosphodiesterase [Actinomycetota bacterium]